MSVKNVFHYSLTFDHLTIQVVRDTSTHIMTINATNELPYAWSDNLSFFSLKEKPGKTIRRFIGSPILLVYEAHSETPLQ